MKSRQVIFILNCNNITIQCYDNDKMIDICIRFCNLVKEKYNDFAYLHKGKLIKSELTFNEQASTSEKISNKMHIFVYKLEEGESLEDITSKEINSFKSPNLYDLILSNIDIKNKVRKVKNIDKNSIINTIKFQNNNNIKNLNNIKSRYIVKILFSYINEKTKLKIIKYNKKIQNKIDIKLINYRMFSERYIIYESNNFGKEYYYINDKLIYEGKYKNGERNGIGKEYDYNGKIIFEGEYKSGKRWNGKGKEFYNDTLKCELKYKNGKINGKVKLYYYANQLEFEGEFMNGVINGKGKLYNINGELISEALYSNGFIYDYKRYDEDNKIQFILKEGKGIMKEYSYDNKLIFEGKYINGILNGKVKEYYFDGQLKFEGEYFNGYKWNGKEYDKNRNIINELKNGKGYIKIYNENKIQFEGEYLDGEKNGKGKEFYGNGMLKFEGIYKNGEKNGYGKEFDINGFLIFEGEYLNGKRANGKLKNYYYDGKVIFEGEYLNFNINGNIKEYYTNGNIKFEGIYLYGYKLSGKEYKIDKSLQFEGEFLFNKKWDGKGYDRNCKIIYTLNNGNGIIKKYHDNGKLKFEGEIKNGKKNGKGKKYDTHGRLIFEGEYLNNKVWNGIGHVYNDNDVLEAKAKFINGVIQNYVH